MIDANSYLLHRKENIDMSAHHAMAARIPKVSNERYRLTYEADGILELLQETFDDKELAALIANMCRVMDSPIEAPACCHAVVNRIKELSRQQAERNIP